MKNMEIANKIENFLWSMSNFIENALPEIGDNTAELIACGLGEIRTSMQKRHFGALILSKELDQNLKMALLAELEIFNVIDDDKKMEVGAIILESLAQLKFPPWLLGIIELLKGFLKIVQLCIL